MSDRVDSVAHVIQVALTPIFLFTGVASLLSVLSTRLGRVADHVDALTDKLDFATPDARSRLEKRLAYLRRRSQALDAAVIMATLGGVLTLLAAMLLFLDVLREHAGASLFIAFGLALLMTIGGLGGFLYEMLLASRGIRFEAAASEEEPELAEPPHETHTEPVHDGGGDAGAA